MALTRGRFLQTSSAALGLAHLLESTLPFIRNIALARLLEPREFALALALAAIVGMTEMISDVGLPQYALRAGIEDSRFRNTLHSLALIRASVIGGLITLAAYPLALLFQKPESVWAFAVAGLTVALKGLSNLASKQMTREGRFGPEAISIIVSQIGWTLAVVGFSFLFHDHRAMAGGMLIYVLSLVAVTNLLLPARFGLAWDTEIVASAVRYGRPLVPNGVALAITSLSDRLIIGGLRSLDSLAIYGSLSATAMLPRATALRYTYGLFLPSMVKAEAAGLDLQAPSTAWFATLSLVTVAFALGFMCLAQPTIALVFGARYEPAPVLVTLMGVLLACRMIVAFPVPIAMARARTWFVTGSSVISAVALLPAAIALFLTAGDLTQGLAVFLGTLVVVETIGIALILLRTRRAFPDATAGIFRAASIVAILVLGTAAFCHAIEATTWTDRLVPCTIGVAISAAMFGPAVVKFFVNHSQHISSS